MVCVPQEVLEDRYGDDKRVIYHLGVRKAAKLAGLESLVLELCGYLNRITAILYYQSL